MQEHNAQSRAHLLSSLSTDALWYLRIQAKGLDLSTLQDGSVRETIEFDLAGKFMEPEEIMDAVGQGVYAYKYNFVALDDPDGMGRPWRNTVINTRTTL